MFLTALLGAVIAIAFSAVPQLFKPSTLGKALPWIVVGFVFDLILNLTLVFFFRPPLTGPFGGYEWLWFTVLINTIVAGVMAYFVGEESRDDNTYHILAATGSGLLLLVGVVGMLLVNIFTTWGDGNTKSLASYPNIVVSKESVLPETDPAHIVMVPLEVARYRGGQVLGGSGGNLGSIYHADYYTIQSVAGHLYWVAPLVYNNMWANLGNFELPGVVSVDAEDPNGEARLRLDYKLHYVPDAIWDQELSRHIYLAGGYENYRLIDPTLEMDDDWHPHFTVDLSTYVRGFTGIKVEKMAVVDSVSGKIEVHDLDKVPAWVDRIIPGSAAQDYIDWWGLWSNAPWFNLSGQGQQMSADDVPDIAYSRADKSPVWQFIMTSSSQKDKSSTGVILFDTRTNKGTFYPLAGVAVGSDVVHAFESTTANIKKFPVKQVILHNIYGEPTWVASYVSPFDEKDQTKGAFQAFGLLNARTVQGSDVIMAPTKQEALREYQRWIANHGSNTVNPTDINTTKEIVGRVVRVASEVQSGNTVYSLIIRDESGAIVNRVFTAPSTVSEKLPFTKEGDRVAIRYHDVNQRTTAITEFNNLDLPVYPVNPTTGAPVVPANLPTLVPTRTATPRPTATPNPLFEQKPK